MTVSLYSHSSHASRSLTGLSLFDFLSYFCFCLSISVLFWTPAPTPQWDLEEWLASLCSVLLSFPHLPPIWIPSLTFIASYFLWPYYLLLLLPPYLPLFPSIVSWTLALCFPVGSLSESLPLFLSPLHSASVRMTCALAYNTAYPTLEWNVTKYLMCIVESIWFCYMQLKERGLPALLVRGGHWLYCDSSGSTV